MWFRNELSSLAEVSLYIYIYIYIYILYLFNGFVFVFCCFFVVVEMQFGCLRQTTASYNYADSALPFSRHGSTPLIYAPGSCLGAPPGETSLWWPDVKAASQLDAALHRWCKVCSRRGEYFAVSQASGHATTRGRFSFLEGCFDLPTIQIGGYYFYEVPTSVVSHR